LNEKQFILAEPVLEGEPLHQQVLS